MSSPQFNHLRTETKCVQPFTATYRTSYHGVLPVYAFTSFLQHSSCAVSAGPFNRLLPPRLTRLAFTPFCSTPLALISPSITSYHRV